MLTVSFNILRGIIQFPFVLYYIDTIPCPVFVGFNLKVEKGGLNFFDSLTSGVVNH